MGGSAYSNREVEGSVPEEAVVEAVPTGTATELVVEPNPKDKDRVQITEKLGVHEEWYKEARNIRTKEEFCAFIDKLDLKYGHDYGTICHAVAAAALAGAWVMERTDQGGITGFQSGAVMWEFIQHWMGKGGPMRLVDYEDMLYPQYEPKFDKAISQETADWLKVEAQKLIDRPGQDTIHPDVMAHWKNIAAGNLPWGFTVKEEN